MKVTLPVRGTDGREQHAIDILLVVGDEKVRFPAEVTLRQAGFTVIAATDIPTALTLAGEYQPELLVVSNPEQYHQYQDLIYGIWPEVRPLLVGQVRALPGATDSAPMPSFIDCARLIQQIKQIKGEARKDPAGESPVA